MRHDGTFRVAHELKKTLNEVMGWRGPPTARQHVAWQAWLDAEWDRPSRTDWYLMALRAEIIRYANARAGMTAEEIKIANLKLVFVPEGPPPDDADLEALQQHEMNVSKSIWLARVGKDNPRLIKEVQQPVPRDGEGYIEEQPDFSNWHEVGQARGN